MRIIINYEAVWQNSFLDGSNNDPLPVKGRGFIGSNTKLNARDKEGKYVNFITRRISHDTVMGILNRLIGDQRKLYQARKCTDYFFADIEGKVSFNQSHSAVSSEVIYIRNMTGNMDQNSFTGLIKRNDPIFTSEYSNEFWGVLGLDFTSLCQFIIKPYFKVVSTKRYDPLAVCDRFEELNDFKAIEVVNEIEEALMVLQEKFSNDNVNYRDEKGMIRPIKFYCSALYLQVYRLGQQATILTKKGCISGISKGSFTKKDFMNSYAGGKKLIWGNPYLLKIKRKGEGEITSMLNKVNGTLEINLNISQEKSLCLKEMIDDAGVSSFYLGKKGLAYVESIRV